MSKKLRLLIGFVLLSLPLVSCLNTSYQTALKRQQSKTKFDLVYGTYPAYRIDKLLGKICIVGSGEGKDEISAFLTQRIMEWSPNIVIIEPGNLEAVLGGSVIEYGTGLGKDEAQALSQLLQVDHVLFFDEKDTPHEEYIYGGRQETQIRLKIVNTRSGQIVFQTVKRWGAYFPDPRPTFSHITAQSNQIPRNFCISMLDFELAYVLGHVYAGLRWEPGSMVVSKVLSDSPADISGIKEGDRILSIAGIKIRGGSHVKAVLRNSKQGDTQKVGLERNGKHIEVEINYPVISEHPSVEREKEKKEQKYPIKTI